MPTFLKVAALSLVLFLILFLAVVATGQTFGQRCQAQGYTWGSLEFDKCVSRLQKGS